MSADRLDVLVPMAARPVCAALVTRGTPKNFIWTCDFGIKAIVFEYFGGPGTLERDSLRVGGKIIGGCRGFCGTWEVLTPSVPSFRNPHLPTLELHQRGSSLGSSASTEPNGNSVLQPRKNKNFQLFHKDQIGRTKRPKLSCCLLRRNKLTSSRNLSSPKQIPQIEDRMINHPPT